MTALISITVAVGWCNDCNF